MHITWRLTQFWEGNCFFSSMKIAKDFFTVRPLHVHIIAGEYLFRKVGQWLSASWSCIRMYQYSCHVQTVVTSEVDGKLCQTESYCYHEKYLSIYKSRWQAGPGVSLVTLCNFRKVTSWDPESEMGVWDWAVHSLDKRTNLVWLKDEGIQRKWKKGKHSEAFILCSLTSSACSVVWCIVSLVSVCTCMDRQRGCLTWINNKYRRNKWWTQREMISELCTCPQKQNKGKYSDCWDYP